MLHSSDGSRVAAVINSAERRRLLVLAVEQAAISLAVVLAGVILMLLLGTQILAWYWLAFLAAAGLALVAIRVRSQPIPRYRLAQIIDRRLRLSDSLSTAWFLLSQSRGKDSIARLQIQRAEQIAGSVQLARAFPFSGRRPWTLAGVLGTLAFGLFAVRYLVTSSLSLQQALVPIHLGPVLEVAPPSPSTDKLQASPFSADSRTGLAQSAEAQHQNNKLDASAPQEAIPGEPAGAAAAPATQAGKSQPDSTEMADGRSSNGPAAHDESHTIAGKNGSPSQDSADRKTQGTQAPQSSSSLLDNMKDALSSLMAKMRPNATSQQSARNGERSEEDRHNGNQTALGRDPRAEHAGTRSDQASQQQSTEGEARGQATEKAQASQSRSSNESSARSGSDSKSGVGRQDGNKDLKEAEQLQAMGKLEEIIGKRSADLTGEMTVETPSGKQQLKTEYSQQMGHHLDRGGEINRDEIPLMYQQYIRDYMEAVRKEQRPQ